MSIYPLYILYAHIGKSITLPQQTKQTPAPHPSHSVQQGRYLFDCFTRAFGACRGLLRLNRQAIINTYIQVTDEGFPPFRKYT